MASTVDPAAGAESDVVVRVVDLHKSFGLLHVLKGVSFEVRRGDVVSVIGASGSGKSTLLRCLNHLETPTAGEVHVAGRPVGFRVDASGRRRPSSHAEINALRMDIGIVFQQFNLWPHMTVLGNVMEAPRRVRKLPAAQAREIARRHLEKVNL